MYAQICPKTHKGEDTTREAQK